MPKKGIALLARVADGRDLPLGAAHAEAAGHQDRRRRRRAAASAPVALDLLESTKRSFDAHVVGDAAVHQRLVEALVALGQLDVLADHRDLAPRAAAGS